MLRNKSNQLPIESIETNIFNGHQQYQTDSLLKSDVDVTWATKLKYYF